jgi:hypothetical protein
MWLTGRLMPDFKTIANFRKDNSKAIRGVCRQFVVLCQQLGLFEENLVAIDGSKFKAVNNRDRNFTNANLKRRMEEIESSINRYLAALDTADRQEPNSSEPKAARPEEKIAKLKVQMKELQAIEIQLNESPDKQVSLRGPGRASGAGAHAARSVAHLGKLKCRGQVRLWPTPKERAEQMALLQGEPTEAFEWFKVDRAIGKVRNQGPELIEPVGS